jgi:solute carrier family 25 oxoglutarate transporter 11
MQLFGQMNPGKPVPSFPGLLSAMVKRDGPLSVYKGVDAAIGRQMVYGTARIGLHRTFSDKLVEMNEGHPISFVQKALSGMASGSIAVCIGTPFDIALVRLQSDGMAKPEDRRNYKNVFDVSTDHRQLLLLCIVAWCWLVVLLWSLFELVVLTGSRFFSLYIYNIL